MTVAQQQTESKARREEFRRVIAEQRRRLMPTEQQVARAKKAADMLLESIKNQAASHQDEITGVEIGGSYKKGTWLGAPEMDIDVYIRFKEDVPPKAFKKIAIDVGFAALQGHSPYLRYSEHPYVEAKIGRGILANVVPCYDIQEAGMWRSAADRSRFHTEYMKTALRGNKRNDVRLLKAFLKASGLYGAQIARNGFSGYVSEVLVAHYGSFEKVITKFADMTPGTVIGMAAKEFTSMITIMDPTDKNRNLAAAISDEKIVRFVMACRALVASPSFDFFDSKRMTKIKSRRGAAAAYWNNILAIRFGFKRRAPDVIWGQSKKSAAKIARCMADGGFVILRQNTHVEMDDCMVHMFFLLESMVIPQGYVQRGPEFIMRNSLNTYIKRGMSGKKTGAADGERAYMMWVDTEGKISALKKRTDTAAGTHLRRILKQKDILPPSLNANPRVWTGRGDLDGGSNRGSSHKRAKEAAEELIQSDASIIHFT